MRRPGPSTSTLTVVVATAAALAAAHLLGCSDGASDKAQAQAPKPKTRVLVVGFDGMSWDVIGPWLEQGRMPNLQRLIDGGVRAPLRTIFPPSSPPAWTSAITGVNPGKHGIFGFMNPIRGDGKAKFATAFDRRYVPIWTLLSRAERRVGIINVPCTSPPDSVNGFMVGGFPHSDDLPVFYPPELRQRFPGYQTDVFADKPVPGAEEEWLRTLENVHAERQALALEMLSKGGYDLFYVVFTATDRVQHFFWKHMDPRHPLHDPARAARLGTTIRDFHERVDRSLGELIAAAGPGAVTLVLSDHGFGPLYRGIAVEPLLALLNPDVAPGTPPRSYLYSYFGGLLYLSVRGREPFGTVEPGEPYERLRDELASILRTVADPADGKPLVREVFRREDVYSGDAIDGAPDLLFLERDGYLVTRFPSATLVGTLPPREFSGFHRMEGVLILNGPGIKSGQALASASILDLAPTLLHLLGQAVPTYMDGRALMAAFEPDALADNPPRTVELQPSLYRERRATSAAPAPEIEEQLRSLGYVQ